VALAQLEGEFLVVLVLVALEDVGLQLELGGVHDQARVAVDRHQAGIARARHQHVELAAGLAGAVGAGELGHHHGLFRHALVHRRQGARLHLLDEHRGLLQLGQRVCGKSRAAQHAEGGSLEENASDHVPALHLV
jgi:hypothetical protein